MCVFMFVCVATEECAGVEAVDQIHQLEISAFVFFSSPVSSSSSSMPLFPHPFFHYFLFLTLSSCQSVSLSEGMSLQGHLRSTSSGLIPVWGLLIPACCTGTVGHIFKGKTGFVFLRTVNQHMYFWGIYVLLMKLGLVISFLSSVYKTFIAFNHSTSIVPRPKKSSLWENK